ncbi:MAG: glycoside hydrolase family 99-like domain-containing protein [Endomicrobia bacterium]|nr:glycoside hydrolase family 99-like domain-containing protein [Endomicrobiia bacterium]
MTQKIKSLFFLASVILLTGLLFCGQAYSQIRSKTTNKNDPDYISLGMYYFDAWYPKPGPGWPGPDPWMYNNGVRNIHINMRTDFPEREPFLGWYDQTEPGIVEQQVDWMINYGIDFIVFTFIYQAGYTYEQMIKQSAGLFKYLESPRRGEIDFAILWCYPGFPEDKDAWDRIVNYWLDNFLLRPEYKRIDGKPVIFLWRNFNNDALNAGFASAAEMLDRAKELARKRGINDLYFVICITPPTQGQYDEALITGVNAITTYNWPQSSDYSKSKPDYYWEITDFYKRPLGWQRFLNMPEVANGQIPFFLPLLAGYDTRAWGRDVECFSTPDEFEAHLIDGRDRILANPAQTMRTAVICAWNEHGEGSVVEPTKKYKFEYLERIMKVFRGMSINNVTPDTGVRGLTLNLTATGVGFQNGATIKLVSGSTVINGTGATQSGTTAITASFALPAGIADGTKFDLTVTNPNSDYVTKTQAVTVYNALTVTDFTPLNTNVGNVLITVNGTGFINGYSKIILKNASNESQTIIPSTTSVSATQIAGTFTVTSSGTWKVYVRAYDNGPEYAATANMIIAANTAYNLFAYEGAEITFTVISKDSAQSMGKMIILERTFSEDLTVDVKQNSSLAPADSHVRELSHTNVGVIIDAQGKKPEREIELRIPYNNSDITGMNEESLVISRYDEEKNVWIPIKSKVDSENKQIIAYIDKISVYAIMGTANVVKAFENMKYYPNPLQPSKGLNYSRMHFSNIPAGTRIKIYTMLGQIVKDLEADASGMAVWDGKNNAGAKAASGVYIVYMKDGSGNEKRIKIAVER